MKLCGSCTYHDPQRQICAINMAYQAFVYVDTPAHDCPAWQDVEKVKAERAMQSQCRPADTADPLFFMGVQVVQP